MELKKTLLVALATTLALGSCTDFTNGFDEKAHYYQENFVKQFGEIDPNQDFVAVDGGNVEVSATQDAKILIYADGLATNLLIREAAVKAGQTVSLGYDVPVGVKDIIVVAKGDNYWDAKKVSVGENGKVEFVKKATRSEVATYTAQPRHKIDHVGGSYTLSCDESFKDQWNRDVVNDGKGTLVNYWGTTILNATHTDQSHTNEIIYDPAQGWGEYYAINEWPYTNSDWSMTNNSLNQTGTMSLPYTKVQLNEIQEKAIKAIFGDTENTIKLKEYTKDFSVYTKESGEITLTYVFGQTGGKGGLGYCYTKENTPEAIKAAPKYMLFVNEQDLAAGQVYHLTYYGEDGTGTPSLTFPEGYYINFFVLTSTDGTGLSAWHTNEYQIQTGIKDIGNYQTEPIYYTWNDVYGMDLAHQAIYSQHELNEPVKSHIGGNNYICASTAAWSTLGFNCLSFEDYPNADAVDADWNDICFLINAPIEDFKSYDKSEDFIVACEDLGNQYDFDYNDVVYKISHIYQETEANGTTTISYQPVINVTLLAAGGILPASVWYDVNENGTYESGTDVMIFDEVHSAFGSSELVPINVGEKTLPKVSKPVELVQLAGNETAAAAWRISDKAKNFKITIQNGGDKVLAGDAGAIEITEELANISTPKYEGAVPSAFLIPVSSDADFQIPNDKVRINTIYPNWNNWVRNRDSANWYDASFWNNNTVKPDPDVDPDTPDPIDPELTTTITDNIADGLVFNASYFPSTCTSATITFTHDDTTNRLYVALQANNQHSSEKESSAANSEITFTLSATELAAAKAGNLKITDYNSGGLSHVVKIVITTE